MVKRISVKDSMKSPAGELLRKAPVSSNKLDDSSKITNNDVINNINDSVAEDGIKNAFKNTSVNVSENVIKESRSQAVTVDGPARIEAIENNDTSKNKSNYTNENGSVNKSGIESDNVINIQNKLEKIKKPKVDKGDNAISKFLEKNRKVKFEDSHSKDTFWIDNNLLATLKKLTSGNKGIKTKVINESLRNFFKENGIKVENED